jgi:hypothetical protein
VPAKKTKKKAKSKAAGWRCPKCKRTFKSKNQQHSCARRTVASFFVGKPAVRAIYDHLLARLAPLGALRVDASRAGINFAVRSHFAGATVVRDALRVGFVRRGKLAHPRFVQHEFVGNDRYVHRVDLASTGDVDDELLGWLADAYAVNAALP